MRKNFRLFVMVVIIAFIGITTTESSDYYICGDANCDKTCNVADAVWIINYIFAGGSNPCDADGNGIPDCEPNCPWTTDIDGNVYHAIKIGDQWWMAENLKVTHYRNGDPIPIVTDNSTWEGLSTGAYCNYDNNECYGDIYGRLYNWHAVDDSRNITPEGWHVPSDAEWKQLEMYLGMSQAEADNTGWRGTDEGGKLKESGTTHWYPPNIGATNESGFTALPTGIRQRFGPFEGIGNYGYFWSSTERYSDQAWHRDLSYIHSGVGRGSSYRQFGFSVRCVRD